MRITDTYKGDKIPRSVKWIYSTGTIARDAAYQLISSFLLIYMQYCAPLGLNPDGTKNSTLFMAQWGVITIIIILLRIWDGFNDPVMGWIVEKVHFKTGKFKPWILIGGLSNSVVLALMFVLRPTNWAYVVFFGIFYLLWDFTFTMNDIGYWSMLPSLSSDEKERNTITTMVAICASFGAFACVGLLPIIVGGNAQTMYSICAVVISTLFCLSQVFLFFFCKEHERDPKQDKISEESNFKDMFKILKNNKQVLVSTLAMLLYYCGSSVLTRIGLNYFYLVYNYSVGGSMMTIFTVFYAIGTLGAQFLFPLLSKKFTRDQLFKFCFWIIVIFYTVFFFYDLKLSNGLVLGFAKFGEQNIADILVLAVLGIGIFGAQGIFYLVLIVMMTNTIEYNEYEFGERKESVIFALRPLCAKLADAAKEGIYYLTFVVAGLYPLFSSINDIEVQRGAHVGDFASGASEDALTDLAKQKVDKLIGSDLSPIQLLIAKAFMCFAPVILFIFAYLFIRRKYIINEKFYDNMKAELDKRKQA